VAPTQTKRAFSPGWWLQTGLKEALVRLVAPCIGGLVKKLFVRQEVLGLSPRQRVGTGTDNPVPGLKWVGNRDY
jgi:hypothetical protein